MDPPTFLQEEIVLLEGHAGARLGAGEAFPPRTQGETDEADFVRWELGERTAALRIFHGEVKVGLRLFAQGRKGSYLIPVRRSHKQPDLEAGLAYTAQV
jgi:hypothetical protein